MIGFLAWFAVRPGRIVGAGLVLVIGILVVENQLLERARDRAERRAREERLGRLNAEAVADTGRQLFADSLRGYSRLVEQLRVQSHSRLEARDREAAARADVELRFRRLLGVLHTVAAEDSAGVRSAELKVDSAPVHLRATVQIPPPPGPARWDFSAWLDPARFTLELACDHDRARADLVSPSWLDLRLLKVVQDPAICSPPVQTRLRAPRLGFGAGVGFGVIRNGSGLYAGPGGFVGVLLRF